MEIQEDGEEIGAWGGGFVKREEKVLVDVEVRMMMISAFVGVGGKVASGSDTRSESLWVAARRGRDVRTAGVWGKSRRARDGNRRQLRAEGGSGAAKLSLSEIQELLSSEDGVDRARAINQARFLEPNECLDALIGAVNDPNPQLRYAVVSQLATAGKADPERTLEIVKDIVANDKEPTVQAAAADVITGLGLPDSFDLLQDLYSSSNDWMLRFSILSGLGELGDIRAYDLLIDALTTSGDDSPLIKVAALGSLGELGDKRAIDAVKPFLDDEDSTISERAKVALDLLSASDVE